MDSVVQETRSCVLTRPCRRLLKKGQYILTKAQKLQTCIGLKASIVLNSSVSQNTVQLDNHIGAWHNVYPCIAMNRSVTKNIIQLYKSCSTFIHVCDVPVTMNSVLWFVTCWWHQVCLKLCENVYTPVTICGMLPTYNQENAHLFFQMEEIQDEVSWAPLQIHREIWYYKLRCHWYIILTWLMFHMPLSFRTLIYCAAIISACHCVHFL